MPHNWSHRMGVTQRHPSPLKATRKDSEDERIDRKVWRTKRDRLIRFCTRISALFLCVLLTLRFSQVFTFSAVYCSIHERNLLGWNLLGFAPSKDHLANVFGTRSSAKILSERPNPEQPLTVLLFYHDFPEAEAYKSIQSGAFAQLGMKKPKVFGQQVRKTMSECSEWCRFATSMEDPREADVILFELNRFGNVAGDTWCVQDFPWPLRHPLDVRLNDDRPVKPLHQLWGWISFEQPTQFPILVDPYYLQRVDFHMNWKQGSDIPITYICPFNPDDQVGSSFLKMPDIARKEPGKIAAYVASRCRAKERDLYISQMMKHMFVHSFGKCLHNSDFPHRTAYMWDEKVKVLSTFKFVLVFENSNEYSDWVTEKIVHALLAGAVPVYWGATNIREFLPGDKAAIVAADFASPEALAKHLLYLDQNDDAYMEHFAWKNRPLSHNFTKHLNRCVFQSECRVCDYYRKIYAQSRT